MYDNILNKIPQYSAFLTVDEMDKSSLQLAEDYPDAVKIFKAGKSRNNHPIYCLKIGNGSKKALAYGCPHPNEPIGAMMLEYFSKALAENKEFREVLDYTWYIIKSCDPDGTKLNEGWFKGPYTIYNYAKNFFRPAMNQQVEWTFPIDYKDLHFNKPIAETKVLMDIIDEIKPEFIYSLHNAGFGGAFWYITKKFGKEVYKAYHNASIEQGVPLSLGEPEVPFAENFAPAIYKLIDTVEFYDYFEKYTKINPAEMIKYGTSSNGYANKDSYNSTVLVCELPYFYDKRIDDSSESDMMRRDSIIKNCNQEEEFLNTIIEEYNKIEEFITNNNPFMLAVADRLKFGTGGVEAKREWARNNKELFGKATVAQKFDSLVVSKFYNILYIGMIIRASEYELNNSSEVNDKKLSTLKESIYKMEKLLKKSAEELEMELDYSVIPISKLIRIQLECGLITAQELK